MIEINVTGNAQQRLNTLDNKAHQVDNTIRNLIKSFVAFEVVKQSITKVITTFSDLQKQILDIQKTTGLAGANLEELRQDFVRLSTTVNGMEISKLYEVASIAGQLGIKGKENIQEFTREITKLSVTSDLTAQQAGESFAQLSNALGEPISKIKNLSSTFTALASSTTASEKTLVNYVQRLAGAGTTLGLTTAQIAGIGATLKDVGLTAELSSTAMSQVFIKLLTDSKKITSVLGLDYKEFSKSIKEEPVQALNLFLATLGKLDKYSKVKALKAMKMQGAGLSSTLLKLSSNTEKLITNINTANSAYIKAEATNKEFDIASQSLSASQEKLTSAVKEASYQIGKALEPALKSTINTLTESITAVTNNTEHYGRLALVVGGVTTAFYTLYKAHKAYITLQVGSAIGSTLGTLATMSKLDKAVMAVSYAYIGLQKAVAGFNLVMRLTPWGMAIAGATGLALALNNLFETEKRREELFNKQVKYKASPQYEKDTRAKEYDKIIAKEKLYQRTVIATQNTIKNNSSLNSKQKSILQANLDKQREILSNLTIQREQLEKFYPQLKKIKDNSKINVKVDGKIKDLEVPKVNAPKINIPIDGDTTALNNTLRDMNNDIKRASLSRYEYEKFLINQQANDYRKLGVSIQTIQKWKTSKVKVLDLENSKKLKDSLNMIDNDIKRSTLSRFNYEKTLIDKQAKKYKDLGVSIQKITEWKHAKIRLLNAEKEKEELKKTERLLKEFTGRYNNIGLSDYELKLKNLSKDLAKYKEAGVTQEQIQELYIDNVRKFAKEQISQEAQKTKELIRQRKLEHEKTLESTKQLREFKKIAVNIAKQAGQTILQDYAKTGDVKGAINTYTDSNQLSSSLMSSGNAYAQALAVTGALISGALTKPMDKFQSLQSNVGKENKSIVNSLDTLNKTMNPHLKYTKMMASYLYSIQSNLARTAVNIKGDSFATGSDFGAEFNQIGGGLSKEISNIFSLDGVLSSLGLDNAVTNFFGDLGEGLISAVFGSTETSLLEAGISFGEQSVKTFTEGVNAVTFQNVKKTTKHLFGLIKHSNVESNFKDVNERTANAFQSVMQDGIDSIIGSAINLDLYWDGLVGEIQSYIIETTKFNFKDMSTKEIQDTLTGWFGKTFDDITAKEFPIVKKFKKDNETAFETLIRVNAEFEKAVYQTSQLGVELGSFSNIKSSKALEALSSDTSRYIEIFKTEAEKVNIVTQNLGLVFSDYNIKIPTTKEGMTSLVNSLDLTIEKNQLLYGQLMKNSEAIGQYIAMLDKNKQQFKESQDNLKDYLEFRGLSDLEKTQKELDNAKEELAKSGDGFLNLDNYFEVVERFKKIYGEDFYKSDNGSKRFKDVAEQLLKIGKLEDELNKKREDSLQNLINQETDKFKSFQEWSNTYNKTPQESSKYLYEQSQKDLRGTIEELNNFSVTRFVKGEDVKQYEIEIDKLKNEKRDLGRNGDLKGITINPFKSFEIQRKIEELQKKISDSRKDGYQNARTSEEASRANELKSLISSLKIEIRNPLTTTDDRVKATDKLRDYNRELDSIIKPFSFSLNSSFDDYIKRYNEALKGGLTKTEIELWDKLGESIKQNTIRQDEYSKSMEKQQDETQKAIDDTFKSIRDNIQGTIYSLTDSVREDKSVQSRSVSDLIEYNRLKENIQGEISKSNPDTERLNKYTERLTDVAGNIGGYAETGLKSQLRDDLKGLLQEVPKENEQDLRERENTKNLKDTVRLLGVGIDENDRQRKLLQVLIDEIKTYDQDKLAILTKLSNYD